MDYKIVYLEEKTVAGITARTNNSSPQMGEVIGGLWNRFFEEVYGEIPNKISPFTLGIYTDYSSDETGDYTIMTACEVIPNGDNLLETLKIPAGKYAEFEIVGDMNTTEQFKEIQRLWQEIWKMDLERSFVCDFEEYRSNDPNKADIHIFIGLK